MPESKSTTPHPRASASLSWRRKLAFSAITTTCFFLLLEASLAVFGVQRVIDVEDPFVGFDQHLPLMEIARDDSGETVVSTASNKLTWFNQQSFPRKKTAGTKRIFCLGGSTTYGRPYQDVTSYCGWLRQLLPIAEAGSRWEVINAGGISYASYRVAHLMEELLKYEPDLFIVYTAHNEFLERRTYQDMFDRPNWSRRANLALSRTRTWSLLRHAVGKGKPQASSPQETLSGEVDEILNHTVGPADYVRDDDWRRKVVRHYELNLQRMITMAEAAGAKVLLITPAANEKDCSPFKSESNVNLSEDAVGRFRSAVENAEKAWQARDLESALDQYLAAAAIDDRHALLQYRMGRLLLQMGRDQQARTAFVRAIDEDVCPLRAVKEIRQAVREVSQSRSVPLVDFEAKLRAQCLRDHQHGCLGGEYFLDHVHPTIEIHKQLALWILQAMADQGLLAASESVDERRIQLVDAKIRQQIGPHAQGVALRNLAKVLHWAGKFEEAAPRAADALELIEGDLESQFVLADSLINMGELGAGYARYEQLFAKGDFPRAYLPFGELLADRGEMQQAKYYLTLSATLDPDVRRRARAQFSLGCVHLSLKEFDFAVESLEIAKNLFPEDRVTTERLAEAKAGAGQTDEAVDLYRQTLSSDDADADIHHRIGLLMLKLKRYQQAVSEFQAALAIDPNHGEAKRNLAIAKSIVETTAGQPVAPQ